MAYKRVLLSNLIAHEDSHFVPQAMLRAGLGYLAQTLQDSGCECVVVDMALGYGFDHLIKAIEDFKPDLFGASLFTYRYSASGERLAALKKRFPALPIVCGGPHVSTFQERILTQCSAVDFALMGEADRSLVQLCRGDDPEEIPKLLYRVGSTVKRSQAPYVPPDINALPFPRYAGFELSRYPQRGIPLSERVIPIVTSRGCPYDCTYCSVKTAIGKKFRARLPAGIVEELAYWYGLGYRRFSIIDDNFTLLRDRVRQICELIIQKGLSGISISLPNGIRADKVDAALSR